MIKCALCGFEFSPEENIACVSCPLKRNCKVICCPNCGYQTVEEGKLGEGFKKLFHKIRRRNSGSQNR